MKISANTLRHVMNLWPPFFATGIRLLLIAPDWRYAKVRLRWHHWNRNFVGTHFGGSLFAMTDPFWMILVMQSIGNDYIVWDKSASIDFIAPGRTDVFAEFHLTEARLQEIRDATASGEKFLTWFETEVKDADGTLIALVRKQVYVRRKRQPRMP